MKGWEFPWADPGEGPGGPKPHPPIFGPNWGPKCRKKILGRPPPTPPPPPPLPCLFQGLDPGLISLVKVYKKSKETVMSVWKRPKRANRYTSWLTVKKSRKRFLVWFVYVWETVHLQKLKRMQRSKLGMLRGYHLSLEGIRKGYLVFVKNSICKGTVLDLGAEPPRIKLFEYPPPPPISLFTGCSERVLSGESSEVERKKRSTFGCYLWRPGSQRSWG